MSENLKCKVHHVSLGHAYNVDCEQRMGYLVCGSSIFSLLGDKFHGVLDFVGRPHSQGFVEVF
jgi:hypothetical protein